MARILQSPALREILRPLGQMIVFIAASGLALGAFMVVLALLMRGSAIDLALVERQKVDLLTFTLSNLPQVLLDGVALGFVYAAIALGYTMVYGVLEFINFAHSEIFAAGAFIGVELLLFLERLGLLEGIGFWPAFVVLLLVILAAMLGSGLLAVSVEATAYRPLRNAPRLVPLISAIGVSFFLQDAIRLIESVTTGAFHRIIPTFGDLDSRIRLAQFFIAHAEVDLDIQVKSLIVIGAAVVMLVGLNYFVNVTRTGKAIRAVAQDRATASLMGINVNAIISITFLVGGALGGAAGVLYALKFTRIDPFVGFFPGLKAFTAAVLGGIGNLTGALLGGIVLAMLESFAGAYMSAFTNGAFGAEYKDIFAFSILILVLIFRPSGLLGEQVGQKA
jgi:branched-chain amino acid transport system permease protein